MSMTRKIGWIFAGALVALGACATGNVPHEKLAASEGSIRAAEEVGASEVPDAALHLLLAKEQTEKARQLIKDDENDRAKYVLMRAQADAELAITLSKEAAAVTEAELAMAQVRALQSGKPLIP
jgi:hypothetical protein